MFLRRRPKAPKVERALQDDCLALFLSMGAPMEQARRMAREVIGKAKDDSVKEKTWEMPLDTGDRILQSERRDEKMRGRLAVLRAEGVQDDDIRSWWNRHDLERRVVIAMDNVLRLSALNACLRSSRNPTQCGAEVRKCLPVYRQDALRDYIPQEPWENGDDRPLPYELRNRISGYNRKRMETDPEAFQKELKASTSYNALIREEVRRGHL